MKRILLSLLTVSSFVITMIITPQIYTNSFLSGDINYDGTINDTDLITLQKYLLEGDGLIADADLCSDGVTDIFDLIELRKIISENKKCPVMLNEICASNKSSFIEKNDNSPDWIEMYNNSTETFDISEFGLSDDDNNRFKFIFPNGTLIQPKSYMLVICDGTSFSDDNYFHAEFKISSGETIYLTSPDIQYEDGVSADCLTIPDTDTDISYGRFLDGSDNIVTLTPTPNKSNNDAEQIHRTDYPVFSHDAGFYNRSFLLELSNSNDNIILYTLDGSNPQTSDTAIVYDKAIRIYNNNSDENRFINRITDENGNVNNPSSGDVDKGIVIKAVCKSQNGEFSNVVTKSYFVGKTAPYYPKMKVISMSVNESDLFDNEAGIYSDYNKWNKGKEWERPANIQIFEQGKPVYSENIGIRIAGNSSRECLQKSFTLYARSEYGKTKMKYAWIDGLTDIYGNIIKEYDKITLRNSSDDWSQLKIRDTLLQKLVSKRNLCLQGQEFCILFINGEFWGLYSITEKYDENYIESHYKVDKDDCTYFEIWNDVKGSETVLNDYRNFFEWAVTADMSNTENYTKVCETIDIQNMMDYITFQTYINNSDWMSDENGNISNNWAMWRSDSVDKSIPYHDGKWRFMVYDTERSASLFNLENTKYDYDLLGHMEKNGLYLNISNIFYNLLNNESFRNDYYSNYIDMIENIFDRDTTDREILEMSDLTREAAERTNICFSNSDSNKQYDKNLDTLREFFSERPSFARKYLDDLIKKYSQK